MRVGILTFHNTPNIGASLQCAALARFISSLGHDVEVINYAPFRTRWKYLEWMFKGKNRSIRHVGRMLKLKGYFKSHVRLSGRAIFTHKQLTRHCGDTYDALVIGSDEVWKENALRRFDTAYFGSFVSPETTRIIMYAPSSSAESALVKNTATIAPLLHQMHAISVRDAQTGQELTQTYGIEAPLVLDPTLLEPFTEETHVAPPFPNYLAVYAEKTEPHTLALRAFADRNGLKLVGLGFENPAFDKCYVGLGPGEWMSLMRQSSAVFTHFYHGIIFALIYGRPLFAHVDNSKRHKVRNLIEIVGLEHLLHATPDQISEMTLGDLAYPASQLQRIDPMVAQSRAYLKQALSS